MGAHMGDRPIAGDCVAIGWSEIGDLRKIDGTREAYKIAIKRGFPDMKPKTVPLAAGNVYKFTHVIQPGDFVIYPSKSNRMVNIGRFKGMPTYHEGDADTYPNRRAVDWLGHFPRNDFSQSALNEIGSAVTLFRVKRHAAEFLSKVGTDFGANCIATLESPEETPDDMQDDDAATVSVSRQAEETTDDFIVRRIMAGLTGYQFEELVAHVIECMGYTARVTPKSGDGGVDVIAHMDALEFQPPIVKIQCKRTTGQHSNAEVNQLLGTLGDGEFGLFVTLGSFSRAARELERSRPKLRLIDGDSFVELLLDNYAKLSPRYRSIVPLKQIYVPDLPDG
jgi:restriction system protein